MTDVSPHERVCEDAHRSDPSPASHAESSAAFLNRVAGSCWDQVRHLVDEWVAHIPVDSRVDIIARLKSAQDRQSTAAFWELYLHETFTRAGFDVELHPAVDGRVHRA